MDSSTVQCIVYDIAVPFRQTGYKVPYKLSSATFLPNVKFQNARGKDRYLTSSWVAGGVAPIGPRPVVLSLPLLGRVAVVAQRSISLVFELSRERSVGLSVCPAASALHCGKTADRIRMPFGIVGRTSPVMRQVVGFGDRSTGRVLLGANLGRAIVYRDL